MPIQIFEGAFAVEDVTSHGCAIGIRKAGRASTFTLVGFDGMPEQVENLNSLETQRWIYKKELPP